LHRHLLPDFGTYRAPDNHSSLVECNGKTPAAPYVPLWAGSPPKVEALLCAHYGANRALQFAAYDRPAWEWRN
jgi:hypothetical protein